MPGAGVPEEDRLFADLAVSQGLCSREQVEECLSLLARLIEGGVGSPPRLGELLLRRGYLTPAGLQATLRPDSAPSAARAPGRLGAADLPAEASAASADPANLFGKYVRVARLGMGGMGEVWKGWDRELGRWVALKFLRHDDPEQVLRFRREAQTAARLSHPNIASVYEVGESAGKPFLAMQYVSGTTLSALPRDRIRPLVALVRDAARAVHYAHEQGVVHRDLKPANLMAEGERVFVMDFGLAKPAALDSSLSISGAILGTPAYMAPEQARGDSRRVGPPSDVYALGATLYDLLAGRPPFVDKDVYVLIRKAIDEEPLPLRRRNARVDRDLETIVLKCLEKEPARRYAGARELAEDLSRWLDGAAILAHPPSPGYRLRKFLARRRAVVAMAAAGLLAVTVTLAVLVPKGIEQRRALERQRAEAADREKALKDLGTLWADVAVVKEWTRQPARTPDEIRRELGKLTDKLSDYVRRHPDHPQGYYVRARARMILGDLRGAEADARAALRVEQAFSPGWALLGRLLVERYTLLLYGTTGESWAPGGSGKPLLEEAERAMAQGWRQGAERIAIDTWGVARTREDDVNETIARALRECYVDDDRDAAARRLGAALSASRSEEILRWLSHLSPETEKRAAFLEEAVARAPHYAIARLDRAVRRQQQGDVRGALEDLESAIRIDPGFAVALNNWAHLKWRAGDAKGAVEDYDRAIAADPGFAIAFTNRGNALGDLKDLDGALASHTKAIEINPRFAAAWFNRGQVRREKGDLEGAWADFNQAVEADSRYAFGYIGRGGILRRRGDLRGAEREYGLAIDADPGSALARYNRGHVREDLGDLAGALEDLDRAIELDPKGSDAYVNRGGIRGRRGEFRAALEDLDRAISLNGRSAMAHNNRGAMRQSTGDLAGALQDYTRAIEIDPKLPLSYSNRGVLRHARNDLPGARADFDRAIELDPRYGKAYSHRGGTRMGQGDLAGALADLTKAIELEPGFPDAYANRGLVHQARKDAAAAVADFEAALRLARPGWPHAASVRKWLDEARR